MIFSVRHPREGVHLVRVQGRAHGVARLKTKRKVIGGQIRVDSSNSETHLEVVSVQMELQRPLEEGSHPVGDLGVGQKDLSGRLVWVLLVASVAWDVVVLNEKMVLA